MSGYKELTLRFMLDEDEPLGVRPNERLIVMSVQRGAPADGHLQPGDQIQSVNGRPVKNPEEFYRAMRVANPSIVVRRATSQNMLPVELKPSNDPGENLPGDIAMAINRRPGYQYRLIKVPRERGKKFGMAIKTRDNRVIVCSVEAGSMCDEHLKLLDHIIYVNGTRVTQADVAQPLLVRGMKEKGAIECVVARPTTKEAIETANRVLSREEEHDPPSITLNLDVQQIMRQQLIRAAGNTDATTKGILQKPGQPPLGRVEFGTNHQVIGIVSDHPGRAMRVVNPCPNSPVRQR